MATKFVSLDKLSHFLLKLKDEFVVDKSYVHTDSNYTATDKAKVANLPDNTTTALEGKVDKVSGKGLSTEDYTSDEKAKLEDIEENANNYSLPTASATTLGGVKIGANVTVATDGTISVTALEWENINNRPTKLSEFDNDSAFITKAVSDLTNYYTKTTTYTKDEVNDLIGAVKTIQFQIVESLPATGESNIIYLVSNGGTAPNVYDEYAWITSSKTFEKIGSTDIDLSGYWSKTDLTECTNDEIDKLFATE